MFDESDKRSNKTPGFDTPDPRLRRNIGVAGAIFIAFNSVVGAGIFGVPGKLFELLGAYSPLAFIVFGLLFLPIVASFAALARRFQSTGGPSLYVAEAFGSTAAYYTGWIDYISRATVGAANCNVLLFYIAALASMQLTGITKALLIVLIYGSIALVNVIGVGRAIGALRWFTLLKIAPLIMLALYGLAKGGANFSIPFSDSKFDGVGAAVLLVFYAFIGFESANLPGGETKEPRRTIGIGMIAVFCMAIALYTIIQLSYVLVVGDADQTDAPLAHMAQLLIGPAGLAVITSVAVFSITGNLIVNALGGPRISFALARQSSLPEWFANVSDRFHTPQNSIAFFTGLVIVLAISGTFVWLAVAGILARLLVYVMSIIALLKLQQDRKLANDDKAKEQVSILTPLLAILVCLAVMTSAPVPAWGFAHYAPSRWIFIAKIRRWRR